VLVGVIVVFATLLAERSPWMYDISSGKLFTLSEETRQVVAALASPLRIFAVYPQGGADPLVSSLLAEYAKLGSNLTVEYLDAERDPTRLASLNLGVKRQNSDFGGTVPQYPGWQRLLGRTADHQCHPLCHLQPDAHPVFSGRAG
jgi:hypothetical protein